MLRPPSVQTGLAPPGSRRPHGSGSMGASPGGPGLWALAPSRLADRVLHVPKTRANRCEPVQNLVCIGVPSPSAFTILLAWPMARLAKKPAASFDAAGLWGCAPVEPLETVAQPGPPWDSHIMAST